MTFTPYDPDASAMQLERFERVAREATGNRRKGAQSDAQGPALRGQIEPGAEGGDDSPFGRVLDRITRQAKERAAQKKSAPTARPAAPARSAAVKSTPAVAQRKPGKPAAVKPAAPTFAHLRPAPGARSTDARPMATKPRAETPAEFAARAAAVMEKLGR